MHSDQRLGLYISQRLRQIKLSQGEFGSYLGRDRFYVHRVIKGQTLSPSQLPIVAKVLGVSVHNLMEPPNVQ
jgi:hypothetical protein